MLFVERKIQYLFSRNLLATISHHTFFGKNKPSEQKYKSSKDSHLHTFLLKEGNKNLNESPLLSINDYDEAIKTEETSEAYSKRGWAYFYIKDYDQAMNDINKAIKLNPRSSEPLCAAACIEIAQNRHYEALQYLADALDLTSPIDFRRKAIEEVINGSKLALKLDINNIDNNNNNNDNVIAATPAMPQPLDMPFDNADFMNLQKDLTAQMCTIGGEEFQAKLMKLNEIPAVKNFQRKALSGDKPDYNDYMQLMKDNKFKKYNDVMTEIAKNPKFESVTVKFSEMDWMGAYEELQKDPDALALYMKAFEALDDD